MTKLEDERRSTPRRTTADGEGIGAVAIALTALLVIGTTAGVVDHLRTSDVCAAMRNAAAAAALAGAIHAHDGADGGAAAADRAAAATIAEMGLRFGADTITGVRLTENKGTVTASATIVEATLTWRASVATDLTQLFGLNGHSIAGTATASSPLGPRSTAAATTAPPVTPSSTSTCASPSFLTRSSIALAP